MAEASGVDNAGEGSSQSWLQPKKEEVEDFTFDEPCHKKQKTSSACQGRQKASHTSGLQALADKLDMNWDLIEVFYKLIQSNLYILKVHYWRRQKEACMVQQFFIAYSNKIIKSIKSACGKRIMYLLAHMMSCEAIRNFSRKWKNYYFDVHNVSNC